MALIDSKQLNPKFSGSFILSGSAQSFISEQVVIGSETGSATAHSNAALTILMGGKSGMMLPSASADPSGLGTSDKGLLYFDATDSLLKTFDGIKGFKDELTWLKPVLQPIYDGKILQMIRPLLDVFFKPLASHCALLVLRNEK